MRPPALVTPGNVLISGAIVAPPLAVLAPLGLAPVLALLAAALLASDARGCVAALRAFAPLMALLVALSLWAALTAAWSPIPGHSLFEAGRLLAISAIGIVVLGAGASLSSAEAERLGVAACIGVAAAVVLLQMEFWGGSPVWHLFHRGQFDWYVPLAVYDRGVTVLLLASWPAAAALLAGHKHRMLVAPGAVVVGATLAQFASHAAMLAGALGLAALLLAWRLPRLTALAMISLAFLVAFAYPATAPGGPAIAHVQARAPMLWPSAIHRLVIWRFVADRIADRPLRGWGMDASRAIPGGEEPVSAFMPGVKLPATATVLPLHTHDAALQWRLELGLPGALLCLAIMALVLWRLADGARLPPLQRAVALACAAAVLIIAMLSFGAWQAWWLSAVWLVSALLAGVQPRAVS